jgi:excisionase family DNA binding protein
MDQNSDSTQRLTVSEAAEVLGISAEAIRQRIKRNTIPHTKIGSTVYVTLEHDMTGQYTDQKRHDKDRTALIESQQDQIEYLRQQLDQANEANRELRRLIAGLTQRIPELPAPPDGSINVDQEQRPQHQEEQHRPFWRRLLGG